MKNREKRICFVAQFPPPIHGLSHAVEMLFESELGQKFKFDKVNITSNKYFFSNCFKILFCRADVFYFTISQTKGGNVRDLIFLILMGLKKRKIIVHLHGGYLRTLLENDCCSIQRKLNLKLLSKIDCAIVLSESLKKIFGGIISEDRIAVIPNCVEEECVPSEDKIIEKTDSFDKVKKVLYLSNLIETKGYREVLNMALVEKNRVDDGEERALYFEFAGAFFDEKEKTFFEDFVNQNELSDFVTYHGIVLGEEKNALLKECHFFVLPTRYPKEGQPISIIEAMFNGMAIISTDNAAIPDMVDTDKNLVIKMEEFDAKKAYSYILNMDRKKWVEVSNINRRRALENYSYSKYVTNFEELFDSI